MRYLVLFQTDGKMDQRTVEAIDVQTAIKKFAHDQAKLLCLTDERGNRFDPEGNSEWNPQLDN
jgi:hypothetical protein